jgi:hydrogenase maturation protease
LTTTSTVVIGVGNEYRRDDGIGAAVIAQLHQHNLDDVTLTLADGEPSQLLDAWTGVALAVVVDAVLCQPSTPGRIHRTTIDHQPHRTARASTHGLGIPDAIRLADTLDRAPGRLVVFAVEAAELGFGLGMSSAVTAALPELTRAVLAELGVNE